jgi:3-dehydroquinate synthase
VTDDLSFVIGGARTDVLFRREPHWPDAAVTVYDSNTVRLFGSGSRNPVTIPAGEAAKGWPSGHALLAHCAALGISRDATVAGVGGGVVCDVTAFAASLFMRGCGLVLIPTTLLAMVDASLGGKTGIDFQGYKNMVGTFYPASRILISAETVRSLPEREYLSGIAEVIKTAIIGDPELFSLLERSYDRVMSRDPSAVQEMIRRSLSVKGRIVETDPKESGERALPRAPLRPCPGDRHRIHRLDPRGSGGMGDGEGTRRRSSDGPDGRGFWGSCAFPVEEIRLPSRRRRELR